MNLSKLIFLTTGLYWLNLVQAQTFQEHRYCPLYLTHQINERSTPFLDRYFKVTSVSGQYVSYAIPIGLFAVSFINKNQEMKRKGLVHSSAVVLSMVLTNTLKYTIKAKRPFERCNHIKKKDIGGSPSFPSGHTSDAFALATSLSLTYSKWYVIIPAYLWAGSVAYGRVYQGVHSVKDVIGGILVGSISAYVSWKISSILFESRHKSAYRVLKVVY